MSHRFGLSMGLLMLWLAACGTTVETESNATSTSSSSSCSGAQGTLEGTVYYWGPPGSPDSQIAANVDVLLVQGMDVLHAQTDAQGAFSVPIAAGSYVVSADDNAGCLTAQPTSATVTACETTTVTVLLDVCAG